MPQGNGLRIVEWGMRIEICLTAYSLKAYSLSAPRLNPLSTPGWVIPDMPQGNGLRIVEWGMRIEIYLTAYSLKAYSLSAPPSQSPLYTRKVCSRHRRREVDCGLWNGECGLKFA